MEAHRFSGFLAGLLTLASTTSPLPADLNLDAYFDHIERTRDLDAGGLLQLHEPFGPYQAGVTPRDEAPLYFEQIDNWLDLTDGELLLLQRHDFVVSERWRHDSYGDAFEAIYRQDLPAFVSTDAILHAVHKSYDDLLALAEDSYLRPRLWSVLVDMYRHWPRLEERYGRDARMLESLADIDVYLTVALKLLDPRTSRGSQGGNDSKVGHILRLIDREQPAEIELFNNIARVYDFSQFKPRGHYTGETYPKLSNYFRAMMWLGRTEFRLTPSPPPPVIDVTREIIDAFLLLEIIQESGVAEDWKEIDRILTLLIAPSDNVTFEEMERLGEALGLDSAASLLQPGVKDAFDRELTSGDYTAQLILSQILQFHKWRPDTVRIPYAFLLMGQRFLMDSFITGHVVYPFVPCITRYDPPLCRKMPKPFDVLYPLGNDDVLPFLRSGIEYYEYAPQLSALRYLIDNVEEDYWRGSLYYSWLQSIRTLAKSGRQENVPHFMRTGAWQQQKMNTQLAAWAELRHDNLLYGKQSYTGLEPICSFPCTYVEPIPAFYEALEQFSESAGEVFSGIPQMPAGVGEFFASMKSTMARLRGIAEKELSGAPFTEDEKRFLKSIIYHHWKEWWDGCSPGWMWTHTGWYQRLFFRLDGRETEPATEPDALIADIHTDPNTRGILHVATGHPELGIFVAAPAGYPATAYIGPVASYHEHATFNFHRLSDEEWNEIYESDPPARPDWTYVYLADERGNIRQSGQVLEDETGLPDAPWHWVYPPPPVEEPGTPADSTDTPPGDDPPGEEPEDLSESGDDNISFFSINPNPTDRGTIVSLRIAAGGAVPIRLRVYDSQGSLVRKLHEGWVPSHLVHVQWDGTTDSGRPVGAGVYYVRLDIGERLSRTRKVIVVN
jgi:hypothetical protein